jgi:hypothetical protein
VRVHPRHLAAFTAAATVLTAACATPSEPAPVTVTVTSTVPPTSPPSTPMAAPPPDVPPVPCADGDLTVGHGEVASDGSTRRVSVRFRNSSSRACSLQGYPGADLVTAAGGVLVHVARRPQLAAPMLTLRPGDTATADVEASARDSTSGSPCARVGTLVVTAPNTVVAHTLAVNLPICDATIGSAT